MVTLQLTGYFKLKQFLIVMTVSTDKFGSVCQGDISFDEAPSPQNLEIHTDALIICRVSGEPQPTVSWRYNDQVITAGRKLDIIGFCYLRSIFVGCITKV